MPWDFQPSKPNLSGPIPRLNPVQCMDKVPRSQVNAERRAARLRAEGEPNAGCYMCPICGRWHVTKNQLNPRSTNKHG